MIVIKTEQAKKERAAVFDDLRKVKPGTGKRYGSHYYVPRVPVLPEFTDRIYRYKDLEMNLFHLTCTCEAFNDKLLRGYEDRDIRRLCIHLYYKLLSSAASKNIDQLSRILMDAALKHNAQYFFKYYFRKEDKEVYFAFSNHSEWINVFIQVLPGSDADFVRFGYNPSAHRWNYGKAPELASRIEYVIEMIIKRELPARVNYAQKPGRE